MINLRNQKGSITLFVLISCLFFVASVACVQMYMQSKKIAVDREYRAIKSNYEGNTLAKRLLKIVLNLKAHYLKRDWLRLAPMLIMVAGLM